MPHFKGIPKGRNVSILIYTKTAVLVVLKLIGVLSWGWWIVLSLFIMYWVFTVLLLVGVYITLNQNEDYEKHDDKTSD